MTLPENRGYFNSPSVYRGSTPKGGGSLKNDFLDTPFSHFPEKNKKPGPSNKSGLAGT